MNIKKDVLKLSAALSSLAVLLFPLGVAAAASTVTVTPANTQGWAFNRDQTTKTPYEFNEDQASIGEGSLYVLPITNTLGSPGTKDKFIAEKSLNVPSSELSGISYDFLIAGNGDSTDANQFYLNVYTILPNSTAPFFDCRFDYVPSSGSTTEFTTATFNATDTPSFVQSRGGASCPTTLSGLAPGSTVRFIALNVGDTSTSASDTGLAGYLDKVVINSSGNVTTYDFEFKNLPKSKDDCKKDGHRNFTNKKGEAFKNQGQCVAFVNHNKDSSTTNNNNVNIRNNNNQSSTSGNANNSGNEGDGSANSGNAQNNNSTNTDVQIKN